MLPKDHATWIPCGCILFLCDIPSPLGNILTCRTCSRHGWSSLRHSKCSYRDWSKFSLCENSFTDYSKPPCCSGPVSSLVEWSQWHKNCSWWYQNSLSIHWTRTLAEPRISGHDQQAARRGKRDSGRTRWTIEKVHAFELLQKMALAIEQRQGREASPKTQRSEVESFGTIGTSGCVSLYWSQPPGTQLEALAEDSVSTSLSSLEYKTTRILSAIALIPGPVSQQQVLDAPPDNKIVNVQVLAESSVKDGGQRSSIIQQPCPTLSERTPAAAPTFLKDSTLAEGK